MKTGSIHNSLWGLLITLAIILLFSGQALATDDGARAYWKGRDGTNVVSFQYLNLNMQASDAKQFAPNQYIYPNADTEANVMIANWARHMTLFNRPSSLSVNLVAGSVDLDASASLDSRFVPPGQTAGTAFSQSSPDTRTPACSLILILWAHQSL